MSAPIRPFTCFVCGGLIIGKDADQGYHLTHENVEHPERYEALGPDIPDELRP